MSSALTSAVSSPGHTSSPEIQHASPGDADADGDGRPPLASLERPIDLVILLAPAADVATVGQALAALPPTLPAAAILVTASGPEFPSPVDPFSTACVHTMAEAGHEEILAPGWVLLPPVGRVLSLARRGNAVHTILQEPGAIDGSGALDVLLSSAAAAMGDRLLVAVYSGNSSDGLDGCARVRAAGGRVIQVTADTSPASLLPAALANREIAHGAWPLREIASVLGECIMHGRHDPRRPARR